MTKKIQILLIASTLLFIGCADNVEITSNVTPPVAKDDQITVKDGDSIDISVLSNDRTSDENTSLDTSTVSIIEDVKEGSTVVNNKGTVTYTSDGVFTGTETFTYQVKDNRGTKSNIATVTVTISSSTNTSNNTTAKAPTAINDRASTTDGVAVIIDVINNDINNGDGLNNPIIIAEASNGVTVVNTSGTITYTPNTAFTGTDTFTYRVEDDNGLGSNIATVTISVS